MTEHSELLRLVLRGSERSNLDYKRSMPWDKESKFGLAKDILCFSNSGGGYLVIGVDQKGKSDEERFTGVADEHLKTWDITDVNKTVASFSSAPIDLELLQLDYSEMGVKFLVLIIPSHRDLPNICTKDKQDKNGSYILRRAAIYQRNKNKSCEEISDPHEVAALIRRCTLYDKEVLLKEFAEIMSAGRADSIKSNVSGNSSIILDIPARVAEKHVNDEVRSFPFWEVICFPVNEIFPIKIEAAKIALCRACREYGGMGWPFIFYLKNSKVPPKFSDNSLFAVHNEAFFAGENAFRYWSFNYEKGVFYSKNLTREAEVGFGNKFDPDWQISRLAEAIRSVGILFENLGIEMNTKLHFMIRYSNMAGVVVSSASRHGPNSWYSSAHGFAGDIIELQRKISISDLLKDAEVLSAEFLVEAIQRIGFDRDIAPSLFVEKATKHLSKFIQHCHIP